MRDKIGPGDRTVVLAGEYDIARKPELAAVLAQAGHAQMLLIDMRAVTYVDSTFLGELAALRLRHAERPVTLIGVQPKVERIFRIAKLDRFFVFQNSG